MIVHISFDYPPEQRDAVHRRFLETGAPPPAGVTMTGRWHCTEGNRGFLVAETRDTAAIANWIQEWSDLISFEVSPVLTDTGFREVISDHGGHEGK